MNNSCHTLLTAARSLEHRHESVVIRRQLHVLTDGQRVTEILRQLI